MKSSNKKSILKSTAGIGVFTLISRFLGIIREILLVRFLGAGAVSDAFIVAYRLPNTLRKVFAEGALSAATVPTLVSIMHKEGKDTVNRLISLLFLVFEAAVLVICVFAIWQADKIVRIFAPGFSPLQVAHTVPYLQILMPFIFFISSSALLASAMQSVRRFFVPAFSPVLLNVVFIFSLIICLTKSLPVEYLCLFLLFGGLIQLLFHLVAYFRLGFSFSRIDKTSWFYFKKVMTKFLPCLLSMSIVEIGLWVDGMFASYLPAGSVSLLSYAGKFMRIPLGVFTVSFATVLLPHFSRTVMYAPKRLGFYLLESAKLIFWASIPMALIMGFFSKKIFTTMFVSGKFTTVQASEAGVILVAFLIGLFFFSINKILLNIYYAKHNTLVPMVVTIAVVLINVGLNFLFVEALQAAGLALATSLAFAFQVAMLTWLLNVKFGVRLYFVKFFEFVYRFILQLFVVLSGVFVIYRVFEAIAGRFPEPFAHFFSDSFGFWLWVGPLIVLSFLIIFLTRKLFCVQVYFLD